jgi:tight adherence protein C
VTFWLPLLAFAFGSLLVTAVVYALTAKPASINDRLRDVMGGQTAAEDTDQSSEQVMAFLKRIGERLPKSPKDLSKIQLRLVQAGYRNSEALPVFLAIRVGFALALFALCMTPLLVKPNVAMALGAAGFGYILPGMALARKAKRRQHRIRLSLADALDLLVVSVEAGLGLDQALARVGQELAFAYPDLSSELRLVNLELLAGKGRSEALRNLADRTGVDDLSSLVAMLVQTDKFGTSVANSLRVFSDTLRTKRRQRAEEAAAKTGVKMVFPLVVCIFPAIWIVTIGPAAIKFIQVLGPMGNK